MAGTITPPASGGGATTLIALTDTPANYGANGQVLTTNGVDAATWETPSAAFALDPTDWVSIAGVQGAGTGTALVAATYPDLSVADGGQALASGPTAVASGAARRVAATTNNTSLQGIDLGDIALNTSGAVAVRLKPYIDGVNIFSTRAWSFSIAIVDGTDSALDNNVLAGFGNSSAAAGPFLWRRNSTAGRGTYSASSSLGYAGARDGSTLDMCVTRDGATGDVAVYGAIAGGPWSRLYNYAAFTTAEAKVMLLMHSGTASLTVACDVTHILPAGVLAQTTPPRVS